MKVCSRKRLSGYRNVFSIKNIYTMAYHSRTCNGRYHMRSSARTSCTSDHGPFYTTSECLTHRTHARIVVTNMLGLQGKRSGHNQNKATPKQFLVIVCAQSRSRLYMTAGPSCSETEERQDQLI